MNISSRRFLWVLIICNIIFLTVTTVGFVSAQALPSDTTTPPMEEMAPAAPVGPAISNVSVKNITNTSAEIDVNSDEMVQGYVEYGTDEQYGMSTPLSSEFSATPSFVLSNLSPQTLYHYRVIVMDTGGNVAITGDETFTTHATPTPEPEPETTPTTEPTATTTSPTSTTTPPATTTPTPTSPTLAISNTETTSVSTSTARIAWQTNKDADAQVQYGTTNTYGTFSPLGVVGSSHTISLSSLTPNTKYYYRAISKTTSGETAYSPAETFTTLAVQVVPTYPTISNVTVSTTTSSATASWMTSKPAMSDIQYGTTTSYGSSIGKSQTFDTNHNRTLSNLAPGTTYHFRIAMTDSDGNVVLGKDRTFTTATNTAPPSSPVITPPVTSTTTTAKNNTDILAKIAKLGSQVSVSQGGGGIPVAPSRPLLLSVTPLDGQVVFDWRKDRGVKNGTIHTLIVRKQGTDPVRSRIDGDIVYDGPSTTFTDTDVINGVEYHYALYSYGAFGRFTPASRFKVVPQSDKEEIDVPVAVVQEQNMPSPVFTRDLFRGKQGSDVTELQMYLSQNGFYPEALITGYFGTLTQKAVMRYQKLNDISPVAGYVGPLTRDVLGQ
jgi:hypothetical protein